MVVMIFKKVMLTLGLAAMLSCGKGDDTGNIANNIPQARVPAVQTFGLEHLVNGIELEGIESADDVQAAIDYFSEAGWSVGRIRMDGSVEEYTQAGITTDTLIARSDSDFALQFYAGNHEEFIRENVDYIVFSPDIVSTLGSGKGDVNGLSFGNGIIAVDTRADNGGIKNPVTFGSVIAHEAQHEFDRHAYRTLVSESRAFARQYDFLQQQVDRELSDEDRLTVQALTNNTTRVLESAEHLEQFGDDYAGVYPNATILAEHFLDGNVAIDVLERDMGISEPSGRGLEVFYASFFSYVVRTNSREDAIEILYDHVTDPENAGTLSQVSAASALKYLCPNALCDESGADIADVSGASFNFDRGSRTDSVGSYAGSAGGFSVSGIPSLEELKEDERFRSYAPESQVVARYRLSAVDRWMESAEDQVRVVHIPNRPGYPSEDFMRCCVQAIDTNRNARADSLEVLYVNNSITDQRGAPIGKIDYFNGAGEYMHSALIWSAYRATGDLADFDPVETAREYDLEILD